METELTHSRFNWFSHAVDPIKSALNPVMSQRRSQVRTFGGYSGSKPGTNMNVSFFTYNLIPVTNIPVGVIKDTSGLHHNCRSSICSFVICQFVLQLRAPKGNKRWYELLSSLSLKYALGYDHFGRFEVAAFFSFSTCPHNFKYMQLSFFLIFAFLVWQTRSL